MGYEVVSIKIKQGVQISGDILIVDDNTPNVELLQAYLESTACTIRTALDGFDALEKIKQRQPDLILLDIMMPRMSGYELCQRIKSNPKTRDIQVLMVTALDEEGDVKRAIECEADEFISKPVNKGFAGHFAVLRKAHVVDQDGSAVT